MDEKENFSALQQNIFQLDTSNGIRTAGRNVREIIKIFGYRKLQLDIYHGISCFRVSLVFAC